jgi:hypothetical protein
MKHIFTSYSRDFLFDGINAYYETPASWAILIIAAPLDDFLRATFSLLSFLQTLAIIYLFSSGTSV